MFCLSMAGPEFIFVLAFGQLMSARAILPKLREFGCKDWTLKHAFYADMGGFVFKPKHWKAFPINAKQLVYLLERKYLTPPVLPLEELDDRDKSDGLARSAQISAQAACLKPDRSQIHRRASDDLVHLECHCKATSEACR